MAIINKMNEVNKNCENKSKLQIAFLSMIDSC